MCPVLDNNHGKYPPWGGGYWVRDDCPVHAPWIAPPGK